MGGKHNSSMELRDYVIYYAIKKRGLENEENY